MNKKTYTKCITPVGSKLPNSRLLIPSVLIIISLFSVNLFAQGTIGIIVNKDLWSSVQGSVEGYAADVETIENKSVWICATTFTETNSETQLKDSLKAHYQNDNLEGAVFIGDLPLVEYQSDGVFKDRDQYVCDLFWMDLDGSWSGSNGVYSGHSGNKEAEIWVSRITASVLENYFDDEATMVNEYFARVKTRMYGQDPMERKYVIAGQKSEWGGLEQENIGDLGYDVDNIDTYEGSCGSQWGAALVDGREYGFVYSHSYETGHSIGYDINDQVSDDMDCRFFNSYACSNGDYEVANMCGAYALADAGLICVGSAKTGSMIPGSFPAYNIPLGEGDCFGEAYRKWFNEEGIDNVYWHYGMALQGAGTLVLEPYASGPYLAITSPSGGEEWEHGNTYDIKWGSNVGGNVKIELLKGGSVDKVIESSTENDGLHALAITIDYTPGNDYKIKISSLDNDTILSESQSNFSIIEEFMITQFPYIQDFDDMDPDVTTTRVLSEHWEQLDGDDMNWLVINGPTPSKVGSDPDKTGPDADHTSTNGNYVYLEASGDGSPQKEAGMITPKFNLKMCQDPELTFYAHMFSATDEMGDIYVDISVDGTWHNDVIHLTDDHGDAWFETKQDLANYVGDRVRIRFRGITGSTWCSDICVDDFMIDGVTATNDVGKKTPSSFGFKYYGSRIHFRVPESSNQMQQVSLKLYNIQGKLIGTLMNGKVKSGYHSVSMDRLFNNGQRLAAGLYLCKMKAGEFTKTINVIVSK